MHIPDGFINNGTAAGLTSVAVGAVSFAMHKVRSAFLEKVPVLKMRLATFPHVGSEGMSMEQRLSKYGREKIWRMATIGSLIFSAQMVNFPVNHGTSGHFLGGVLAALVLGPFEALLMMTVILSVQALLFGDGGIVALGANIFNMGIVGALGGYAYFRLLMQGARDGQKRFLSSAFMAAWVSVIAASVAASFELAFSGTQALEVVLPAMVSVHILIGCVEGLITVFVLMALMKTKYPLAVLSEKQAYEDAME